VQVASDPLDAHAVLLRGHVGVMVVDLDGFGVGGCEILRQLCGTAQRLPISPRLVVITDRRDPREELFARHLGANAILGKPLDARQFCATVDADWTAPCPPPMLSRFFPRSHSRAAR